MQSVILCRVLAIGVKISRHSLFNENGVKLAFVATRSGLTRWEEYRDEHLEEDYEDEVDSIQEP